MKPRVGIGITTYKDVSDPQVGAAIFDAYSANLPSIAPVKVSVRSQRFPIASRADFQQHWLTLIPFEVHERKGGARLETGMHRIGPQWRAKTGGGGSATFRPEMQYDRDDCIVIDHQWAPKGLWLNFFTELVQLCEPSYAMLHLFEAAEVTPLQGPDGIATFDGPFAGEHHFTMWRAESGHWYRPDPWQAAERRQYRFLPQLSWANFLGTEFGGRYDVAAVQNDAASFHSVGEGALFTVTEKLDDIIRQPSHFEERRNALRASFEPGFFRL